MNKSVKRLISTGEVFTSVGLVNKILEEHYHNDSTLFTDKKKVLVDVTCGNGAFLRGVIRKFKQVRSKFTKADWKHAIEYQVKAADLMFDNCAETIYYLLRSWDDESEIKDLKIETETKRTITKDMTPEQINRQFISRTFTDNKGTIEIRRCQNDDHHVEYRIDPKSKKDKWIRVENIIRANSLTEWDFKNWEPKQTKEKLWKSLFGDN